MYGFQLLVVLTWLVCAEPTGLTLNGMVEDADGQPIAGARVDIATAAPRVGQGMFCPSCYLDCRKSARTDDQGQFEIEGLDPTLKFRVLAAKPGKRAQLTGLVDPLDAGLRIPLVDAPTELPPARTVRGQAIDITGRAIEGALVEPEGAKTAERRWWGRVDGVDVTVSDNEGRFTMLLPEGYQGVDIKIMADGYAGNSVELLTPGGQEHKVVLPRGARVTGRLMRADIPLSSARVSVVQLERNVRHHFIKAVGAVTDAEGRFAFDCLPSSEAYVIFSTVGEGSQPFVLTTKRFKAPLDELTRDLGALETIPALRLAGRVELPDGQALPPNTKITLGREPAWDLIAVSLSEDGRFEIDGLPPETYAVRLAIDGFQLDATALAYQMLSDASFGLRLTQSINDLRIPIQACGESPASHRGVSSVQRPADPVPADEPTPPQSGVLSGRVFKGEQPRANVRMKLFRRSFNNAPFREEGETQTDGDGRYRIAGLEPGDQYYFEIIDPEGLVAPGWTYQQPWIQTFGEGLGEKVLPDVRLVTSGQILRGVVVDLHGQPVADVSVSASLTNHQMISRPRQGQPPWTKTDSSGRFELRQLPDEPIELMVHRANTKGGRIMYPAKVQPKSNQVDIRIVFDPLLNQDVEDLDAASK